MQKQLIGSVVRVQVQQASLKIGQRPTSHYDPAGILPTQQMLWRGGGVIGITASAEEVIDIHHPEHPESKYRGDNGLSVNFTSHYTEMRDQFGAHLVDGCAGENILVQTDEHWSLDELGSQLAIEQGESGHFVYLTSLEVAAPCVEFSQYAAHHDGPLAPSEMQATLRYLHNGQRGYYAELSHSTPQVVISVGDRVWRVED